MNKIAVGDLSKKLLFSPACMQVKMGKVLTQCAAASPKVVMNPKVDLVDEASNKTVNDGLGPEVSLKLRKKIKQHKQESGFSLQFNLSIPLLGPV